MANRRTIGGVILNESVRSPMVGSPLRRKSLMLPASPSVRKEGIENHDENADESEKIYRRKETNLDNSKTLEASERRVSLGLVPGLSGSEILDQYNKCMKLCAENKINSKNVFALTMIDYMSVITKQDMSANNMQSASTTLDVSAKIYSVRVDCVHTDIIKMAGEPNQQQKNKENDAEGGENLDNTNTQNSEVKQKKKRSKLLKIIGTEESLAGTLETIDLCSKTKNSDSQTTDKLLQVTLPIHVSSGHNLHLWEDVIFDLRSDNERDPEAVNPVVEISGVENLEKLDVCPSFKNFSITNWSIDDVPDSPSPPQSPADNGLEFDFDASLVDDCNGDNAGLSYFDLNNAGQENVDRCVRRGAKEPEKMVNFVETVADKGKDKSMDYSYLLRGSSNFHWSGPIHWKPRLTARVLGTKDLPTCRQGPVRKKKEPLLEYSDEFLDDFFFKIERTLSRKLQSRTLRQNWHEDKLSLPEDVHYADENPSKLYIHSKALIPLQAEKEAQDKSGAEEAQVEDNVNYNYDNLNDTLDYCSQNNAAEEINGDDDNANGFDNNDDIDDDIEREENENPFGDVYTQGFTGENLVAAPKSTQQIQIQYSTKAKKIDMRQLKKSIWKALTMRNEAGEAEEQEDVVPDPRYFDQIYKQLPNLLGKNNAEALSPALAFTSLLHLANEKSLNIIPVSELSDLKITQG